MQTLLILFCVLSLQAVAGDSSTKCSLDASNRLSIVQQNVPPHIFKQLFTPKRIVFVLELATKSYAKPIIPIAEELIKRGHNVSYAGMPPTFDWMKTVPFSQLIPLRSTPEVNDPTNEALRKMMTEGRASSSKALENGFNGLNLLAYLFKMTAEIWYEGIYRSLQTAFQNDRPDLLICNFGASACFDFGLTNKIPYVVLAPWSGQEMITRLPPFLPGIGSGHTPHSMSFFDRVAQMILNPVLTKYYLDAPLRQLNEARRKVGAAVSDDLSMPYRRKHIFVFNYMGMEIPRYLSPFVHMMGPILGSDDENRMDNELKLWLDGVAERSDESVIYMAFGSLTTLPPDTLRLMISGLLFDAPCENQLPTNGLPPHNKLSKKVHLLWSTVRSDAKEILPADVYENPSSYNLHMVRWAPQIKVLNHPAVKLFVSHAGISSIFESNLAAKPMLLLPGFSDQMYNALRAEEIGFGLKLLVASELSAKEVCLKRGYLLTQYATNATFRQTLEKVARTVYFSTSRPNAVADLLEKEADAESDQLYVLEDEWPLYRLYNLDILALLATLVVVPVLSLYFLICRTKHTTRSKIN